MPRVIELGVTSASAVSEPRTSATTTTDFPRFCDDATFRAYGTDKRRRRRGCSCYSCWYLYVGTRQRNEKGNVYYYALQLHAVDLGLTFAGLHAFRPVMINNIFAAKSPAVLEPSTARSATTGSA